MSEVKGIQKMGRKDEATEDVAGPGKRDRVDWPVE